MISRTWRRSLTRTIPGSASSSASNPLLAADRARKRQELLAATERDLAVIATATQRATRPLRGPAAIGLRVGKVLGRYKVGKHFTISITDRTFRYQRDEAAIAAEAALDGLYVIRTNCPRTGCPRRRRCAPTSGWPRSSEPFAA